VNETAAKRQNSDSSQPKELPSPICGRNTPEGSSSSNSVTPGTPAQSPHSITPTSSSPSSPPSPNTNLIITSTSPSNLLTKSHTVLHGVNSKSSTNENSQLSSSQDMSDHPQIHSIQIDKSNTQEMTIRFDTNPGLLQYPAGIEDYYLNIFSSNEGITDFFDSAEETKGGVPSDVFFEETDSMFSEDTGIVW